MRVAFLGNHTVGVRALRAIHEKAEVVGVVAHPLDPEDGVRYESVFNFARENGWNVMRGKGSDPQTLAFIAAAKPDLLWITDFRYLISRAMIDLAVLGAINLHPSLLPKYRGRAPVNWAILKGETKLGLTGHFVDAGLDSGDIIEQVSYEIREDQDVGDCLNILYPLYTSMTGKILSHFESGSVARTPQDQSHATVFPARKPKDGIINWHESARSILNLIRAVAAPFPGAFTTENGKKLMVWRAHMVAETGSSFPPGYIIEGNQAEILVQCGVGILALTHFDKYDPNDRLDEGCLGT